MKKFWFAAAILVFALNTLPISADIVLVNDNFDRPNGSLAGTAPTPGPGGVWVAHSPAAPLGDLLITSSQAVVQHGVPADDLNVSFANQTSGLLVANFDITVSDDTVIGGGDFEYFAHFSDGGTSNFFSRLDIVAGTGLDYTFGISTNTNTAETIFPTNFSFGTTVNGTLRFDYGTGLASFSVGATTITSTTVLAAPNISAFALRQSDSSNNETINVDNLIITTNVPEPASTVVIGLGLAGLALVRRRK